jgi:hypothetical protein
MPRIDTFTRAAARYLLREPDTAEICREWMTSEPDPEKRALLYAVRLSEDVLTTLRARFDERDPEDRMLLAWLELATRHVNWRRVAELLLRRHGQDSLEGDLPPAKQSRWTVWAMPGG